MLIDDIRNGESDQLEFKEIPNRDADVCMNVSAIVSAIGGGKRSIEREIAALKVSGRIARRGTYAGEWIVLDA